MTKEQREQYFQSAEYMTLKIQREREENMQKEIQKMTRKEMIKKYSKKERQEYAKKCEEECEEGNKIRQLELEKIQKKKTGRRTRTR